ncbi:hypothetical protein [Yoonia sp. SS1-5]|uniref:Uncharacterized protein n=1 Tax=Yoonia rhodophyticola TaxID=3137370 RepID=A0AAN0MA17_9RHOB
MKKAASLLMRFFYFATKTMDHHKKTGPHMQARPAVFRAVQEKLAMPSLPEKL